MTHDTTRDTEQAAGGAARRSGRAVLLGSLGVLAVAVAAVLLLLSQAQVSGVSGFEEADGRSLFRALDDGDARARAVAISGDGRSLSLRRADEDSRWRLAGPDGYPVRQGAVQGLLDSLASLRAAYVSEGDEPAYAEYGLSAPDSSPGSATVVSVHDDAGEPLARAAFGYAFAAPALSGRRGVFVRIEDDPRVWLADREISVPTRRDEWLDNAILDVSGRDVQRLTLSGSGAEGIAVVRDDEGTLQLEQGLPEGTELRGPWVLDMLTGLFEQVEFRGVRAADILPAEAEQVRVASVETGEGIVYRVTLLSPGGDGAAPGTTPEPGEVWATFSAEAAAGADPAAAPQAERFDARHAGWAYLLPLHLIENLSVRPEDIAQRTIAR